MIGAQFDNLDEGVQTEFEEYLEERGINSSLALLIPDLAEWKEQKCASRSLVFTCMLTKCVAGSTSAGSRASRASSRSSLPRLASRVCPCVSPSVPATLHLHRSLLTIELAPSDRVGRVVTLLRGFANKATLAGPLVSARRSFSTSP